MDFKHFEEATQRRELVSRFMGENDEDFTPPFSERGDIEETIDSYTNGKELVQAVKNGEVAGILLFTRGGEREPIDEYCPCLYVNLIIVDRGFRDEGIGSSLYHYLQQNILLESKYEVIGARTWSENHASQSCFEKAGFTKAAEGESDYNHVYYYVFKS